MAMHAAGNAQPMAQINVTPLIDVMLVLLIIFLVTAPIITRPITLDLPQRAPPISPPPPAVAPVELRLDAAGQLYWDGQPIAEAALEQRLREDIGRAADAPALRIAANADAQYEPMARVLAAAKNAGVQRITLAQ